MKQKSLNRFQKLTLAAVLIPSCFATLGCDITVGPKTKTKIVMVKPGLPIRIVQNAKVLGKPLRADDIEPIRIDVGGWVCMPEEHWQALKRSIDEAKKGN